MKLTRLLSLSVALLVTATPSLADCVLREDTASQTLTLPTFVDSTDGVTAETGLTIANTDIKLSKGFAATTQTNKNSGGATHIATGDYYATFDATDSSTVGPLKIKIAVAGALPVYMDCIVVEEAVYDAFYAASAVGYVANAPVNVAQAGGATVTATGGRLEVNTSHWGGTAVGSASVRADVISISGDTGAADRFEAFLDGTCASYPEFGLSRGSGTGCTAQSATSTTLVMDTGAAFADDTAIGMTLIACGSTQGYCQSRVVTDNVGSTDTLTVDTWTVTPSGTVLFTLVDSAPSSGGGGGLDAAGVRAAVGLATANLDTQLAKLDTIDDFLDTEVAAIKTKTDFLPSATAGAAGGVFIAGTNAATTITTALTTTFTGNVTGSVASVTGAVGSVTGAVGSVTGAVASVTGNVGGNVTGSVGSVTGAVGSVTGNVGGTVNGLTSTAQTNMRTALGMASANLDTQLTTIDDFVDTEVATIVTQTGAAAMRTALGLASANLDTQLTAIDDFIDTEVAAIKAKTDQLTFGVTNQLNVNVESQNTAALCGTGTSIDKWRGCP